MDPVSIDLGCGNHKGAEIGIDIDPDSSCDIVADAEYLPLRSSIAGKVVSFEYLEHSHSPLRALKEIFRVLRPGGLSELQSLT